MSAASSGYPSQQSELRAAFGAFRQTFVALFIFSGIINVLYLTGSFFMLLVYDKVIPGRSIETLIGLGVLALMLYVLQGALDGVRSRIMSRIGSAATSKLAPRVFDAIARLPLIDQRRTEGSAPLRDLDQIRSFFASGGPSALFDLPWIPLYVAICWAFHPMIGIIAILGAVILFGLTLLTEKMTKIPTLEAYRMAEYRGAVTESSRRNIEVLQAMGMMGPMQRLFARHNDAYLANQQNAADVGTNIGAVSKVVRLSLQSGVLALGAYLVINQQASSGVMIAATILSARALAPAELVIGHWKSLMGARQAWSRLNEVFSVVGTPRASMPLPAPRQTLEIENLGVAPPGPSQRVIIQNASMRVHAGSAVGVIGPSGSGKSTLARAIVGVWPAYRGTVRLDGAPIAQWSSETLGRHIGYLPQDVELFAGSVAQNISRFEPDHDPVAVIEAATTAGVHELILTLPNGYDTVLSEGGGGLSAGQRQRIGLARSLYRNPFLLVLDEPNSNLDTEGERALTQAILGVRARGGIAIIIAHRPSVLAGVDLVMLVTDGQSRMFGPRDEILQRIGQPIPAHPAAPNAPAQINIVPTTGIPT